MPLLLCSGCGSTRTVRIYSQGDLIRQSVLDEFTEETGIRVVYETDSAEEPTTEDDAAASPIAPMDRFEQLSQAAFGEDNAEYDVFLVSGDIISRLIQEGAVQPLDSTLLPNAQNIDLQYQACDYDPDASYSVTALWETMGLLWNGTGTGVQISSWSALWEEQYAGKILMPDQLRESISVALLELGYEANSQQETELRAAMDHLSAQEPLVLAYGDADSASLMASGDAWIMPAYSSTALNLIGENSDLSFVVPSEGTWRISYGYCIAADTECYEDASALIDFLCREENLAKNAVYSKCSVTSSGALALLDRSWRNNPIAYPDSLLTGEPALLNQITSSAWNDYLTEWEYLITQ
jgi:spermidine/putrescine transport system substrate-binding protein